MSKKNEGESKRVDIRRGKRVQHSYPAGPEWSVRIHTLNSHSSIDKLDLSAEQAALWAIHQPYQLEHNIIHPNNSSVRQLSTSSRLICSAGCLTGDFTIS